MIDLKERFDYLNSLKEFKDGYLTSCVSSTCINNAAKIINSNILDSKYIEEINNTEFGDITIIWHIPSVLYLAAEITDKDVYFHNRSDEVIFKISPPFDTTQFIKLSMILERKIYNHSIPIESYIDSIKYLCTSQIESFRELEKDWDGHGAPKISISCIVNAINIINFQEISCEYINDILANHNGTISIIWDNNREYSVGLEIGNKELSFYVIDKGKRKNEKHLPFTQETYSKISKYIKKLNNKKNEPRLKCTIYHAIIYSSFSYRLLFIP